MDASSHDLLGVCAVRSADNGGGFAIEEPVVFETRQPKFTVRKTAAHGQTQDQSRKEEGADEAAIDGGAHYRLHAQ